MNTLKELWSKKREPKGRVEITIYFINWFLLLCHTFLMVIYMIAVNKFMIALNILSLLLYLGSLNICFKNPDGYIKVSFIEIWIHMIFAIVSFGWTPCFQNWTFALVASYFLPSFSDHKKYTFKNAFIVAGIVITTYFGLAITKDIIDYSLYSPLSDTLNRILFVANNVFTYFTIIMFSLFYTMTNKRREDELSRKADFDELTQIYNRYAFIQASERIRTKGYHLAILDIDHFKDVNDTYGHNSGDLVLKTLANILRPYTTKESVVARWGGEEFILIYSNNISYEEFKKGLEKLRTKIGKQAFTIENKKRINITVSIGTAHINKEETLDKSVSLADENLYKAKETGRNKLIG